MSTTGYIVDASVAAKWFLLEEQEPDVELAIALIGRARVRTTSLAFYEVGNMLTRLSDGDGERVAGALRRMGDICGEPEELRTPDQFRSAELSAEHGITFYDASYVAIAERLRRQVVSADSDLLKPGLAVSLAEAVSTI